MPGKFSTLIRVGTTAVPCSTIKSMVSSVSPVPCSMQSIPALINPGSASSPKTCAVTRAPWAWAASIAALTTSSDHSGAKSPIPRSIQSPPSPNDAGQVVAIVEAAGVDRRSAVAQQQGADLAVGFGLGDRLVEFD